MGTREEIKSFLLPPRIGTAYPFNTHDVLLAAGLDMRSSYCVDYRLVWAQDL